MHTMYSFFVRTVSYEYKMLMKLTKGTNVIKPFFFLRVNVVKLLMAVISEWAKR
jgi:hypothetical protein